METLLQNFQSGITVDEVERISLDFGVFLRKTNQLESVLASNSLTIENKKTSSLREISGVPGFRVDLRQFAIITSSTSTSTPGGEQPVPFRRRGAGGQTLSSSSTHSSTQSSPHGSVQQEPARSTRASTSSTPRAGQSAWPVPGFIPDSDDGEAQSTRRLSGRFSGSSAAASIASLSSLGQSGNRSSFGDGGEDGGGGRFSSQSSVASASSGASTSMRKRRPILSPVVGSSDAGNSSADDADTEGTIITGSRGVVGGKKGKKQKSEQSLQDEPCEGKFALKDLELHQGLLGQLCRSPDNICLPPGGFIDFKSANGRMIRATATEDPNRPFALRDKFRCTKSVGVSKECRSERSGNSCAPCLETWKSNGNAKVGFIKIFIS